MADGSGNWSITSSTLCDGGHTPDGEADRHCRQHQRGLGGASSHIDTTAAAPCAPDLVAASDSFGPTGTNSDNITNDSTPTVTGSGAEAGATVTLYDTNGTTVLGTAVADASGNWTITSSPLSDGVHSLTVKQTDIAGNTSVASAALSRHRRHGGGRAGCAGPDRGVGLVRPDRHEHRQHHQCHHADGDRQRRRGGRDGDAVRH